MKNKKAGFLAGLVLLSLSSVALAESTAAPAATPAAPAATPAPQTVPVAGVAVLGVTATELTAVATGWSAKKSILGKNVFDDTGKKIGEVQDLIISPDKAVSYAIIGVGGFLGMAKHDVAIPVNQFKETSDHKIQLPGATKEALKNLPEFEYAKTR